MPTVKNKMQALLRRGTAFLTPSPSSSNIRDANGFSTAKTETVLFPQTDPAVDGEECLHDCSSCTIHYPAKFSIDEDDKLYGHVKGWDTHLIVGTGKNDWVRDVTDEKGTVMEAVGKFGQDIQLSNGRGMGKVMLSASNMPTGGDHGDCDNEEGADCLLLPSWIMIEKVQPPQVPALMRQIISTSASNKSPLSATKSEPQSPVLTSYKTPTQPQLNGQIEPPTSPTNDAADAAADEPDISSLALTHTPLRTLPAPTSFKTKPIPHSALILMCSHRTRDARCGQSAPLLRKEFERHLRPLGLYRDLHDDRPGGVGIYFINHVGGHKYSANVMIYRRAGSIRSETQLSHPTTQNVVVDEDDEAGIVNDGDVPCERKKLSSEAVQGIWLARVTPEDCENIVRYTVLQGKLVKPQRQLRGGFDRERGLVSW
jgi:Sucrase/ferredoxin-like